METLAQVENEANTAVEAPPKRGRGRPRLPNGKHAQNLAAQAERKAAREQFEAENPTTYSRQARRKAAVEAMGKDAPKIRDDNVSGRANFVRTKASDKPPEVVEPRPRAEALASTIAGPQIPTKYKLKRGEMTAMLTHLYYMQNGTFTPESVALVSIGKLLGVGRHTMYRCIEDCNNAKKLAIEVRKDIVELEELAKENKLQMLRRQVKARERRSELAKDRYVKQRMALQRLREQEILAAKSVPE